MADCTSLDPKNHTLLHLELKEENVWFGTMENCNSRCQHKVLARLVPTSTFSDKSKEEIEKLSAFHGTELIGHGTLLLMQEHKEFPNDENESPSGGGGEDYAEDDSDGPSEALSIERDVLLACKKGSLGDLENLLSGANLSDGGVLFVAVSLKQWHEEEGRPGKEIVRSLLQHGGIDASCKDDLGQSPLHIAARMNDVELVQILMDAGVNVNIRNIQNETPIHVALKNCAGPSFIQYLLNNGADHTLQDNDGNNGLHIAAQAALSCNCKNLDAMFMMLNLQDSIDPTPPAVNTKNYRGYTLEDLLKRLPRNMISQKLKSTLEQQGVVLHGEGEGLEGERDQSDSGPMDDLEDAYMAGGNRSLECTLIITEGQTAKKFAKCGRNFLGTDMYGVYTLRGKLAGTDRDKRKWSKNKQVDSIFTALGLKFSDERNQFVFDKKNLRYGHVLMMMDQDSDGNHIRGLLISMFYYLCQQLLEMPLFLQDFRTYLYKVINARTKETKSFRFLNDYQTWSLGNKEEWIIKYFKGIASNSDEEVKQYFEHFNDHIRYFVWEGVIDANYIERAFSDNNANDRKTWVLEHEDGLYNTSPSSSDRMISFHGFIQKDLVSYFDDSVKRSIPSMMDGLKISQRKIMFTLLEKVAHLKATPVPTLAGLVSDYTAYHHRQTSLESAIVSMAQDFCGTNNLNLLIPKGLFGSRSQGPHISEKAHPYLKAEISPFAHLIFRNEDNDLLDRNIEDEKVVQPKWYAPIFPLILVNGARGIASAFSTSVLKYDASDIIANLERLMNDMATEEMIPSYRDFKGIVAKDKDSNSYTTTGIWDLDVNRTILTISELPVGAWYYSFENDLKAMMTTKTIQSYELITKSPHGEAIRVYKILLTESMDDKAIESKFKLKKTLTSHIYLYNAQGRLRYYTSPDEVLHDFYTERLKIYEKRKDRLIEEGSLASSVTAKELWRKDLDDFKSAYSYNK